MTQEEKAKAYDIALEKIEMFLGSGSSFSREELEYVFPELTESEDERMKEAIIATIHLYYGEPLEDEAKEMIAWLEAQGAKVSAIEGFETEFERQVSGLIASTINKEYEYNQGYVKWTASALLNYAKHELEKQGEQKGEKGNEKEAPFMEWSATDNLNIDAIESIIYKECIAEEASRLITWLRSLKDRVLPQPQQEWSEQDEKRLNTIIGFMNSNPAQNPFYDKSCLERWLRSLRPHEKWKPSEEQMELLKEVQQALLGKDCHNRFTNFMYELKKL